MIFSLLAILTIFWNIALILVLLPVVMAQRQEAWQRFGPGVLMAALLMNTVLLLNAL